MKKPDLPYLDTMTVKGKTYFYFRKGKFRRRLPDNPDTEEFSREYWATRNGQRNAPAKTNWEALIVSYYQSPKFTKRSAGTRANYRRHCEAIREKNGNNDVRNFRRKHAIASRDALSHTWSKANERVAVLSILLKHAADLEWIERNPVVDIEKLKGGEYEAWPDTKLTAFVRYCDEHDETAARTAFELGIGTGQRIGDCCKMQWADFDGEYMRVVQEKTGAHVWIYCPARLRSYLDALPRAGRYIIAKNLIQHIGKRQVQKAIEVVRREIDAMDYVPHGWRYTAAQQLAEAGCSDADIQSVTGHKTLAMVQKYRRQADQKRRSKRAQQEREQNRGES